MDDRRDNRTAFTPIELAVIEKVAIEEVAKNHYPGWVAGDSHSTCGCGWSFNYGLSDPTYTSTPEHQRHLDEEREKLLNLPALETYYQAYKALKPYIEAFKSLGESEA